MNEATATNPILTVTKPERIYSSSALRIARYFWSVASDLRVLELADELQLHPEIPVVGICDAQRIVLGIVRRDRLFALLGKPFGREVLVRSRISEIMDCPASFDAHADIFTVAQDALGAEDDGEIGFHALKDERGAFLGIFSTQDMANHLSRITQDDIGMAAILQNRLLAGNDLSRSGKHRAAAWSRAAKGVGGDFYFSRAIENGRFFYALCDVSGKGVAASIIVSMVWGMLKMYDFKRGLRELLVSLNSSIIATFHMEKYLTGFFMIYDPETRKLVCADMGHSHALLLRQGKTYPVRGKKMNLPIGVEAELEPAIQSYRLAEGDEILIFSDGITEQENAEGIEFGEGRLVRAALEARKDGLDLETGIPAVIDSFKGSAPQQDDMSFFLLTAQA